MTYTAVCMMGPTAAGKTEFAVSLCKRFPFEIISVDSALVYRGMDIGTAKPDGQTLERTPHRLVDIREPEEGYSAGEFVRDASAAMTEIGAAGRIPLLVGGTMMYFRALIAGMSDLPGADAAIRAAIDLEATTAGWPAMHAQLTEVDPESASRITPNDSQRIQRALEVFRVGGKTLSELHQGEPIQAAASRIRFLKLGLAPAPRSRLHSRIEERLNIMINKGFLEEVRQLQKRPKLTRESPAMRAVGYRQFWSHVAGERTLDEARYRTLVATRQLAKRQFTWLRSEQSLKNFDPLEAGAIDAISTYVASKLRQTDTIAGACL